MLGAARIVLCIRICLIAPPREFLSLPALGMLLAARYSLLHLQLYIFRSAVV